MSMTVGMLKARLEGYDDDEPVRIAYQPSWPLAAELADVTSLNDLDIPEADIDDSHHGDKPEAVWLVAGDSPHDDPYAPGALFQTW